MSTIPKGAIKTQTVGWGDGVIDTLILDEPVTDACAVIDTLLDKVIELLADSEGPIVFVTDNDVELDADDDAVAEGLVVCVPNTDDDCVADDEGSVDLVTDNDVELDGDDDTVADDDGSVDLVTDNDVELDGDDDAVADELVVWVIDTDDDAIVVPDGDDVGDADIDCTGPVYICKNAVFVDVNQKTASGGLVVDVV